MSGIIYEMSTSLVCVIVILLSSYSAQAESGFCESPFSSCESDKYCLTFCPALAYSDGARALGLGTNHPSWINLDATLPDLDNRTTRFILGYPTQEASNLAYENGTALPAWQNISQVTFNKFNLQPHHPRFPLSHLLQHNRQRVYALSLLEVKLLRLTEADFTGFVALTELTIETASLTEIARSTFASLGKLPSSPTVQPGKIELLVINQNRDLQALDWSFLRPIAHSVKVIYLVNNGLTKDSLTCSTPFMLDKAERIELGGNHPLTADPTTDGVPTAVSQTLYPSQNITVVYPITQLSAHTLRMIHTMANA